MEITCPYCGREAYLVDSSEVHCKSFGKVWLCRPCFAWVGVHKDDGKNRPLGTLADACTRHARSMTHKTFDPIWLAQLKDGKSKNKVRGEVYAWLARKLGIDEKDCHIAMFDTPTCVRVIEICVERRRRECLESVD